MSKSIGKRWLVSGWQAWQNDDFTKVSSFLGVWIRKIIKPTFQNAPGNQALHYGIFPFLPRAGWIPKLTFQCVCHIQSTWANQTGMYSWLFKFVLTELDKSIGFPERRTSHRGFHHGYLPFLVFTDWLNVYVSAFKSASDTRDGFTCTMWASLSPSVKSLMTHTWRVQKTGPELRLKALCFGSSAWVSGYPSVTVLKRTSPDETPSGSSVPGAVTTVHEHAMTVHQSSSYLFDPDIKAFSDVRCA
jgi:hypothetical protein